MATEPTTTRESTTRWAGETYPDGLFRRRESNYRLDDDALENPKRDETVRIAIADSSRAPTTFEKNLDPMAGRKQHWIVVRFWRGVSGFRWPCERECSGYAAE